MVPRMALVACVVSMGFALTACGESSSTTTLTRPSRPGRTGLRRQPEPAAIAGQGYHDEFTRVTHRVIGDAHVVDGKWHDHIWYDLYPPAGAIFGRNGILHLVSKRSDGFPNITLSTYHPDAAPRTTFRYGYFAARMKWDPTNGAWPGFWLLSSNWAAKGTCPPYPSELDIFEGQGAQPTTFYGTLHRSTNSECVKDQTNSNAQQQVPNVTTGFHTYAALWTDTEVIWYLDDQEVLRAPVFDSTNQNMFLMLDSWVGGWTTKPDSGVSELDTQVDWVRVWQKMPA